jgi:predicted enzyme related to lactoylglutathione lyase
MDMGGGMTYRTFGQGEKMYGGIYNKPLEMPAPPHWLYYINVDDIEAALDRVKEHGGQVLNGPMEVPGGSRIAQCLDPQGAAFALHQSSK